LHHGSDGEVQQDVVFGGSKRVLGKQSKKVAHYWRIIGLGIKCPKEPQEDNIVDKKWPFGGNVSIRGRVFKGMVLSTMMKCTIIIRHNFLHYIKKYRRFEKRQHNVAVHCSPALKEGDIAISGQDRSLQRLTESENQIFGSSASSGQLAQKRAPWHGTEQDESVGIHRASPQ
jgi:small subunit ribosomal protein S11e